MRYLFALALCLASCANSNGTGDDGVGSDDNGAPRNTTQPAPALGGFTFAVVGDTRPPSIDDTSGYPSAIINKIYQDIESESPKPQFVIGTGDYQYASTKKSEQQPQLNDYMTARAAFTGPFYPAMGNHECTGYTSSNCGTGNADGVTKNLTAFINTMLAPIGQTKPYYVETMQATDGSWTAKVVLIACNAWDSTQSTWLTAQLAMPTTYTFVVRHESAADMSDTKCSASQTIVAAHPLTLLVVGHTHEYAHVPSKKEIINGIGGAPLTSGTNYGYTIIGRTTFGTLIVTTYDYSSHAVIDTFSINADGTPATSAPVVQVVSPNGGETWAAGSSQSITWSTANVTNVKVELTTDGTSWSTLSSSTAASAGKLTVTVPATATTAAKVRVSAVPGGSPSDTSDAAFTITTTTSTPKVFINEALANEPGSDTTREFVELVNGGTADADISGWTLSDATSVRHTFAAGTTLHAGKAIVVFGTAAGIPPGLTNAVG
ncbi:MAG TPA: lamin tail domain-containing protein, partial [Kofleriaceae bacterium]|nr:lamin tail domain-containing protein [Kofleriaceae bacterium]